MVSLIIELLVGGAIAVGLAPIHRVNQACPIIIMKTLEHVEAFASLFEIKPNRRGNDQWQIKRDTSLEAIADFFQEQQDRETTDKDHKPLEGLECCRLYLLNYIDSKVQDLTTKDEKNDKGVLIVALELLWKRVNGWWKPTEQSTSVADLKDKVAVLQALADAYDEGDDDKIAELKEKLATLK